jgi:hypothetical protein
METSTLPVLSTRRREAARDALEWRHSSMGLAVEREALKSR